MSATHGATFTIGGQTMSAFPTPQQLLTIESMPGLPDLKLDRLHALARVAADGSLDTAALK